MCRDPTKPALAGHWWLPGMHRAGGETPPASFGKRTALHHLISAGNIGYAAWRDGGFTIHDLSDPAKPKLLSHRNYCAALRRRRAHAAAAARTASCWCSPTRRPSANCANGLAYTWVIDVREPANPVSIATLPTPTEEDFCAKGAKFGPHNLHENRPGALQSEDTIFATYHNAGLRIYDIAQRLRAEASRLFRAAAAGTHRRSAAEPGQGDPVLRRFCRQKRA